MLHHSWTSCVKIIVITPDHLTWILSPTLEHLPWKLIPLTHDSCQNYSSHLTILPEYSVLHLSIFPESSFLSPTILVRTIHHTWPSYLNTQSHTWASSLKAHSSHPRFLSELFITPDHLTWILSPTLEHLPWKLIPLTHDSCQNYSSHMSFLPEDLFNTSGLLTWRHPLHRSFLNVSREDQFITHELLKLLTWRCIHHNETSKMSHLKIHASHLSFSPENQFVTPELLKLLTWRPVHHTCAS